MPVIHHLSDHLISQIAAGEVVERPSSVVKELVENALDAGASEVRVELEAGGKQRIAVIDDGCGMDRDDALLAFDRHATSKIGTFDDLERVGTLGFRGEALASIAAVARVDLRTAPEPGNGHLVRLEGGRVRVAEPHARAKGTTIEIFSLFFNVPARRKFLKAPATELRRALEVVEGYALARPEVRFSLSHEGRALLEATPAGEGMAGARRRIGQIFGQELANDLVELPTRTGDSGERIEGFVGKPGTARSKRLFVFVNRRLLRDRAILSVFYRAVREGWRSEEFPALFLFLEVPPEEVDVNVHPQKAEVRFRDPRLLDRVGGVLRDGLALALGREPAPLREPRFGVREPLAWQGLGQRYPEVTASDTGAWEVREAPGPAWGESPPAEDRPAPFSAAPDRPPEPEGGLAGARLAQPAYAPLERAPMPPIAVPTTSPLSGRRLEPRPFRLLGQYKGTLILLEGPDGLYLLDQHVAHERVLYERMRRALSLKRPASQHLLSALQLALAPAERLRLAELVPALETVGFEIAELSGGTLALTAVPSVLSADEAHKLVLSVASSGLAEASDPEALARQILDALAASQACKAAVKMHHPLKPEEMESLVAELFAAEQPYACPHGRPIVLIMSDTDLERRFGRR
jgi:DNA mismatch repair protein MutL